MSEKGIRLHSLLKGTNYHPFEEKAGCKRVSEHLSFLGREKEVDLNLQVRGR